MITTLGLQTGWYVDNLTGKLCFYDACTGLWYESTPMTPLYPLATGTLLDTYPKTKIFTAASELQGRITDVKIRYDSEEANPPVSGIKAGIEFLIKVKCYNSSSRSVKMILHYKITKPSGQTIEATATEAWPYTSPGGFHTFIEPSFGAILVEAGNWYLELELFAE